LGGIGVAAEAVGDDAACSSGEERNDDDEDEEVAWPPGGRWSGWRPGDLEQTAWTGRRRRFLRSARWIGHHRALGLHVFHSAPHFELTNEVGPPAVVGIEENVTSDRPQQASAETSSAAKLEVLAASGDGREAPRSGALPAVFAVLQVWMTLGPGTGLLPRLTVKDMVGARVDASGRRQTGEATGDPRRADRRLSSAQVAGFELIPRGSPPADLDGLPHRPDLPSSGCARSLPC